MTRLPLGTKEYDEVHLGRASNSVFFVFFVFVFYMYISRTLAGQYLIQDIVWTHRFLLNKNRKAAAGPGYEAKPS